MPQSKSLLGSEKKSEGKFSFDIWEWLLRIAIVGGLLVIVYFSLAAQVFQPIVTAYNSQQWSWILERPSILWIIMGTLMMCLRTLLWFLYKPIPTLSFSEAPTLTVVIPAYNEGAMVHHSIESVAQANYPPHLLEIFVVDDGSKDDTWEHIQVAAAKYPNLVTMIRFDKNQGKRAALEAGFRKAKGEFIVTIDSDSVIEKDTLLAVLAPFKKAKVGAVAGKVNVFNRKQGLIPRMLAVRYILTFDFLRAAQSTYGTVYCCPGALSAYRTSVVRKVVAPWMAQTFMGVPCTYGEDRAMTNFVLLEGYDSVYQNTAIVNTMAPTSYAKLCKMFLRWDRSFVREEFHFAQIVWKRPLKARILSVLDCTMTNLRYPVGYISLVALIYVIHSQPATFLRVCMAIGLMAALNMLYYLRSERSWNFIYGILYAYFSFFALFWIFPYAVITVRAKSWMTR